MGLFNGRKYNATHFTLHGDGSIPKEVVNGLINRTIEVFAAHNCIIDNGTEKKKEGWLEYKLIGGGNITFIMMNPNSLDITSDSPLSKTEFSNVVREIEQYPRSLGWLPGKDYWGLN